MRAVLSATAFLMAVSAGAPAFAQGDAVEGEKVFRRCMTCHMVGPDAAKRVGPPLNGVVGREFGTVEGFKYSDNLMELAGEGSVWSVETLSAYLTNPKDVIPKGIMAFPGLRKEEDIANVIQYIAGFDADGNAVDPAPVVESAAGS